MENLELKNAKTKVRSMIDVSAAKQRRHERGSDLGDG